MSGMNNRGPSVRGKTFAIGLVTVGLAALFVTADVLLGKLTGLDKLRVAAQQFRAEAAPYGLRTQSLIPGTSNEYDHEGSIERKRRFEVGPVGQVLTSNEGGHEGVKILFLGGSTTESNEVHESKRFPSIVERQLNSSGIKSQALNLGVRGHTSQESILSYLSKPGLRNSEVVVMMHNINDRLWLSKFSDYAVDLPSTAPTSWGAVKDSTTQLLVNLWDFVSYKSNAIFLIRQRLLSFNPWSGETTPAGVVSERNIDSSIDSLQKNSPVFARNIRTFIAVARQNNGIPVLMTQPLGIDSEGQKLFNKIIRETATLEKTLLIDLEAEFGSGLRSSWLFLGDGIHLNDEGSEAIGQKIAQAIAGQLGKEIRREKARSIPQEINDIIKRCKMPEAQGSREKASNPTRILGMSARYPSFSSDGKWMIFQNWANQIESLYAYRTVEKQIIPLTPKLDTPINERHPAIVSFSDTHLEVVFGSGFIPGSTALERLMIRHWPRMSTTDLLKDDELGGSIPAVAGERIFFAGYGKKQTDRIPGIMAINRDGTQLTRITRGGHEEWRPALARDGTLFFISNPQGNFDIFSKSKSSESVTRLLGTQGDEWDPAVSPDGRYLVYASKESGRWGLRSFDRKTQRITKLTNGDFDDWDPTFHPSGSVVVFARSENGPPYLHALCLFGEN